MLYILPGGVFHLRLHYSIYIYNIIYIYNNYDCIQSYRYFPRVTIDATFRASGWGGWASRVHSKKTKKNVHSGKIVYNHNIYIIIYNIIYTCIYIYYSEALDERHRLVVYTAYTPTSW